MRPLSIPTRPSAADKRFLRGLGLMAALYALLIVVMLGADASFTTPGELWRALEKPAIRHAIRLSLWSTTLSALLSIWIAVPAAYLLARHRFRGRALLDALFDLPIVLPPMVVGLSLLILFQTPLGRAVEGVVPVTYRVPSVVLAQFVVACAFALRTMRVCFDQLDPRCEEIALTLGCDQKRAFWHVALPGARRGVLGAFLLAWARAFGEFGPVLVFSGATRMRTEVLPSTVFLELSIGEIEAAVAVSLLMVLVAVVVLLGTRALLPEEQPS